MTQAGQFLSPGLLAAIVITLSVGVASDRQCYWCGPLAEQVHRSSRAPSCESAGHHITVCDSGFPYCAVVATAPPYVESRYCVKEYQDECYPQFCNTTNTWKMTCPCPGDLCNGASGVRELEAFEILEKLLKKTHSRITKRAPNNNTTNKQSQIVDPNHEHELDDNSLEDELSKEKSETNSPPIRSSTEASENYTPNPYVPSSASSNLPAEPEQSVISYDSLTTMIEILLKQSNPTDTIHKVNNIVTHEIEISPELPIEKIDHDFNMKRNASSMSSENPPTTQEMNSTLATELVSSDSPTGDSSNTGSPTVEMPVANPNDSTTAHTAQSSMVPLTTDFNPQSTATEPSPADQTPTSPESKLSNSNTKCTKTPTAEAFLQDTPAADKPMEEESQVSSVGTHPPLIQTVPTTENSTTQSTIKTSTVPNTGDSSNKRSKNKNAAVSIQATVLSIIPSIVISSIM